MGAHNVSGALAMYPDLGHRAMRLLIGMSLRALDTATPFTPACRYFAGREDMAEILGYRLGALPDETPAAVRARASAHAQVKKALAELIAAGAVVRVVDGRAGRVSEYLLNVSTVPVDSAVSDGSQGYRNGTSQGYRNGAP